MADARTRAEAANAPAAGSKLRGLRFAGVLGCLAVAAVVGYRWGGDAVSRANDAPLSVAPGNLHFGSVWYQSEFRWKLPLRNESDRPFDVVDLQTSCSCTSAAPRSFTAPPGGTIDLELTINLGPKNAAEAAAESYPFEVEVWAVPRAPGVTAATFLVTGQVRNQFVVAPPGVDFGDDAVRGATPPAREIEVRSPRPIDELLVVPDDRVIVEVAPLSADGRLFKLLVSPSAALLAETGPFEFSLLLAGHDDDPSAAPFPLPVAGRVVDDVRPVPEAVSFGILPPGGSAVETIVLAGTRGPFTASEAKCFGSDTLEVEAVSATDGRAIFRVRERAALQGVVRCRVEFTIRQADRVYQVSVPVGYQGMAVAARASGRE